MYCCVSVCTRILPSACVCADICRVVSAVGMHIKYVFSMVRVQFRPYELHFTLEYYIGQYQSILLSIAMDCVVNQKKKKGLYCQFQSIQRHYHSLSEDFIVNFKGFVVNIRGFIVEIRVFLTRSRSLSHAH